MASVKQLMVRSLTDWFKKYKDKNGKKNPEQIELQDNENADAVSGFHLLEAFHMVDLSFLCYFRYLLRRGSPHREYLIKRPKM